MKKVDLIKRSAFAFVAMMLTAAIANAQAVLPTAWSFDTATPEGWTESLGASNTRYTNGYVGTACRLDQTGDYVLIEIAEEPGALNYALKGQNSGGAWQGTFTVEESADGVAFTPLHTYMNDIPSAAFTEYTDYPAASTRFIRFYYTNKVSGHNTALDEVSLAVPTATDAQEINVASNGNNVPSGATLVIGEAATTMIDVQNLGLANDLNISSVALSGPDVTDFNLNAFPSVVAAQSSEVIELAFAPTGTGARFCTITITSDDASEGEYIVNIYGVAGGISSEPTQQAAAINFTNVSAWDFDVSFDAGSEPAENYIVLRKVGGPVTRMPEDNNTYVRGSWIGDAQVVYVGEAATFNARSIEVSTDYNFAVYAFNGPAGYENYLTDSPLTGVATTMGPQVGSYYAGLNHNSPTFVADLTAKLYPANYFQIFYSNYISTLVNEFYIADTVSANGNAANMVKCQYSNVPDIFEASFQWWNGQNSFNLSREHSYPQSWMPTYLNSGFDGSEEVSDLHNLFPVRQEDCNAVRSNYPYGEVVTVSSSYGPTKYGQNEFGQTCYEPRDEIKGDAARAMMYHAVKNNSTTYDFSFPEQISLFIPYGQLEYVIKKWHFQDAPDNMEMARNEYIETRQNNRNGFIDSTEYACFIRFQNLTNFVPQVLNSNGNLSCIDPAMSYQWYFNGAEIDGATESTYAADQLGSYTVEIQQFEQCPVQSSNAVEVTVSVDELNASGISFEVYPNPSNGQFTMNVTTDHSILADVNVWSLTGAKVATAKQFFANGNNAVRMDYSNLQAGIYILEVKTDAGTITRNLIVE
ncbi:MAG: endonuclease [Flavobacteriales bacterium]